MSSAKLQRLSTTPAGEIESTWLRGVARRPPPLRPVRRRAGGVGLLDGDGDLRLAAAAARRRPAGRRRAGAAA